MVWFNLLVSLPLLLYDMIRFNLCSFQLGQVVHHLWGDDFGPDLCFSSNSL